MSYFQTRDYGLDVQRGLVNGVTFTNKFGRNIDTVSGDAIWSSSSAYVEPATASLCNVVSSSANDTSAGTGANNEDTDNDSIAHVIKII